jgi:hypothetical protein
MVHEKFTQEIRSQIFTLQALLSYLESQENWNEEDLRYCRGTLRRVARELIHASRGRLGTLDVLFLTQR